MYHSLQQLEPADRLPGDSPPQARSTPCSPSRPRVLQLMRGRRERLAQAPPHYACASPAGRASTRQQDQLAI